MLLTHSEKNKLLHGTFKKKRTIDNAISVIGNDEPAITLPNASRPASVSSRSQCRPSFIVRNPFSAGVAITNICIDPPSMAVKRNHRVWVFSSAADGAFNKSRLHYEQSQFVPRVPCPCFWTPIPAGPFVLIETDTSFALLLLPSFPRSPPFCSSSLSRPSLFCLDISVVGGCFGRRLLFLSLPSVCARMPGRVCTLRCGSACLFTAAARR